MVLNCVAYCKNLHDKRNRLSFHSFPFRRPEILKLWIEAVGRENWFPSRTSKLCGDHFLPTDYQDRPGCTHRLLKPDAVPRVFFYPEHVKRKPAITAIPCDQQLSPGDAPSSHHNEDTKNNVSDADDRIIYVHIKEEPEEVDIPEPEEVDTPQPEEVDMPQPEEVDMPQPEEVDTPQPEEVDTPQPEEIDAPEPEPSLPSPPAPVQTDQWTQTHYDFDRQLAKLRRENKTLRQKLQRRDLKISMLSDIIYDVSRSDPNEINLYDILKKYFSDSEASDGE